MYHCGDHERHHIGTVCDKEKTDPDIHHRDTGYKAFRREADLGDMAYNERDHGLPKTKEGLIYHVCRNV